MKILSILFLINFYSLDLFAQQVSTLYYCDILQETSVYVAVENKALQVLKNSGIEIPEGTTLEDIIETPVKYNISSFGEGHDGWYTDVLIYRMQTWVLEKGLFSNRTLVVKVQYSTIVTDDEPFTCIESGQPSQEVVSSIENIDFL